jgi:hypothetical protein
MVVNASWRFYIIRQDQSRFSRPNHKGKGDNHKYVVNVNESNKCI